MADKTLSSTYLANLLAGTLVQGAPSLSLRRALAVWLAGQKDLDATAVLNTNVANALPNWLALQGAMQQKAAVSKTTSFHDALHSLAP